MTVEVLPLPEAGFSFFKRVDSYIEKREARNENLSIPFSRFSSNSSATSTQRSGQNILSDRNPSFRLPTRIGNCCR